MDSAGGFIARTGKPWVDSQGAIAVKLKVDDAGAPVYAGEKLVFVDKDGKDVALDIADMHGRMIVLSADAEKAFKARDEAKAALKAYEGIDDPKAALKALATVKNLADKQLVDAGEVEKVKAEAIKAIEEKYAPVVKDNETLKSQLDHHLIGGAFSGSKYIAEKFAAPGPAGVEIARSLFGNRLKVEGGKVVGYDAQGNKLYSRARPGELADAEEAIEMMVDAYPHKSHILKGNPASGGGASNNNNGGGNKAPTGNWTGSQAERHAAIKQKFPDLPN